MILDANIGAMLGARTASAQAAATEAAQRAHAKEWLEARQALPDHAEAAVEALEAAVRALRVGTCPEDLGPEIIRLGRLMARRS